MITVTEVREIVSSLPVNDAERAHQGEDDLHVAILRTIAGGCSSKEAQALATEALKSDELGFSRWCA